MKDVIIACDFKDAKTTLNFLDQFKNKKPFVKVGMEIFYTEGPSIVRELKARGHKIFLDLKLHDIPNTVKSAMQSLSNLDPDIIDVHAAGTIEMMRAALEGVTRQDGTKPIVVAVTQLTSTSQDIMNHELLIPASMEETVLHYAKNAQKAGLSGIVCSPLEAEIVKKTIGNNFVTITPGIRLANAMKDDQVRVSTPEQAKRIGTDFIVVGRPITRAEDPLAAYHTFLNAFLGEE
ncbi:orotidine-5'-phosphate decarboxylase [Flexilinea flocculi]|uniref:Orotidine 5'-phosphate decarboxylase n=1 Tax=Flexilinea flocculi TaxID=1678840 RepID=A0A0S7BVJ0_9CHLR|nr:orotidine-5'-phosphate decarboxylase [Flexilinea flocculi]GAP41204.1 orotidine-5'-phosphate decarboxylase [Flexilinea flocculi]